LNLISDFLLGTGAFAAAFYCIALARRLKRFTALETGMGGAIAVLSAQVDDMTKALEMARASASASSSGLEDQVRRAESAAARLDLILASLHDLPDDGGQIAEDDRPAEPRIKFVRRRSGRTTALQAAE
jgi:hypothetical protein